MTDRRFTQDDIATIGEARIAGAASGKADAIADGKDEKKAKALGKKAGEASAKAMEKAIVSEYDRREEDEDAKEGRKRKKPDTKMRVHGLPKNSKGYKARAVQVAAEVESGLDPKDVCGMIKRTNIQTEKVKRLAVLRDGTERPWKDGDRDALNKEIKRAKR